MLVSIAMLTYNHEQFIRDAVESCLNQTYENIEICISDDCSTDNTVEIIKKYIEKYPNKIKLFVQKENMGKYTYAINANSMYDLCTGKYIAILEGDDIMLPNRIEEQVKFLEENNDYVAVSHDCETFDHVTGKILNNFFYALKTDKRSTRDLIKYGNTVHTPTVMFRNNTNLRTSYHLKGMLDWLFFIELSKFGKIGHQKKVLTRYRRSVGSASQNIDMIYRDELITLALIEYKYPQYIREVQIYRFNYYLRRPHIKKYINIFFIYGLLFSIKRVIVKIINMIKK